MMGLHYGPKTKETPKSRDSICINKKIRCREFILRSELKVWKIGSGENMAPLLFAKFCQYQVKKILLIV